MLRRYRPFWIILIITALVGLGTILSEHNDYSMSLHVEWMGFDTSRYAVSYADTLLPVSVNVNGFNAIVCYFKAKDRHYVIQAYGDTVVKVGKPLFDDIVDQMEFVGVHGVSSIVEQLRLKLSERQAKAFRPELRDVDFSFDGQYGLAGKPGITPDTVWLYGSPESLARIDRLYTLPTHIRGLSDTTCCSIPCGSAIPTCGPRPTASASSSLWNVSPRRPSRCLSPLWRKTTRFVLAFIPSGWMSPFGCRPGL